MRHRCLARAVALSLVTVAGARAATIVVHPGESIQAAIDAAPDRAKIVVEPGVYHEAGAERALTITRSHVQLLGHPRPGQPVVLEQSGTQVHGVWVSPGDTLSPDEVERPPCGVSGARLERFTLRGFTVQGFPGFGVYLACVDGFDVSDDVARANLTYAIFPVRSSHGRMSRDDASGTLVDACLYVGQDDHVRVDHSRATDCLIGLEIEDAEHVKLDHNVATGNTAGILVDVLNDRQTTVAADNRISDNVVSDNDRPNTAPPEEDTSMIPPGLGIIIQGADRTLVKHNTISGNAFAGFVLVDFCLGMPEACMHPLEIDPNPDGNRVVENTFSGNATDVIYLPGGGAGNCFGRNVPDPLGPGLPACR